MIPNPFKPPIIIKGNKKNVPDNIQVISTCPVIFETKKQYVNELIKNQERIRGVNFSKREEDKFRISELQKMQPVVARYTTKSNPYMPPETVFFTDQKISKDMMREMARHEFNHQAWEPFDRPGSKNMKSRIIKYCNKCQQRTPWKRIENRSDSPLICEMCEDINRR
jgi:hypothetical protein